MAGTLRYHELDIWRRGPRPAKLLTTPPVPLGQFVHLVGRAAYGDDWADVSLPIRLPADRRSRNDADQRVRLVIDDVSSALRDETIQASYQIKLPISELHPSKFLKSVSEQALDLDALTDELEESDEAPDDLSWEPSTDKISVFDIPEEHVHGIVYDIASSFWETDWQAVLNWQTSSIPIPYDYINARVLLRHTRRRFITVPLTSFRPDLNDDNSTVVGSTVTISDGEIAIANMLAVDKLPTANEIDRYNSFRNRLMDEVVAAAWRWLAINRPKPVKVENKDLVDEIRKYLTLHNIDPEIYKLSDSTLINLARQVLNERYHGVSSDIVFKNSSVPLPPRKLLRHK